MFNSQNVGLALPQVFFDTSSFSGATVPTGRGLSLDDFYYEIRNILHMTALSPDEKREALNITLRNKHE